MPPRDAAARTLRADALDPHLVGFLDPTSFAADQYRTLRHLIERSPAPKRVIAVTSAVAGDGKTTTVLNLAAVFAGAADGRVLVIDLDLRTPSVAQRLGVAGPVPGLVDFLLDPALTPEDVVWRHPTAGLAVLPAGRSVSVPYELLRSPRLRALLHDVRQRYDQVIVDTPPVALVSDSRLISGEVDGFVMVVAARRTPRPMLEDALNAMDPAKVIGLVFNGDDRLLSGYYGRYYGHYRTRRGGRRQNRGRTDI